MHKDGIVFSVNLRVTADSIVLDLEYIKVYDVAPKLNAGVAGAAPSPDLFAVTNNSNLSLNFKWLNTGIESRMGRVSKDYMITYSETWVMLELLL